MKMKKIYICLALAALALGSCDDFLDKTPVSKIDSEKFFENEKQLQIYANGLYFDFTPSARMDLQLLEGSVPRQLLP